MKKIISLFQRNYDGDRLVRDEIVPGAEWVVSGEGVATRKLDGTCCLVEDGNLWKRYEVKRGNTAPAAFLPETDVDPDTGKMQGWMPVGDGPEDKWHRETFESYDNGLLAGTYELVGPNIQGNPESLGDRWFVEHGQGLAGTLKPQPPRTFDGLKKWLGSTDIEGIVWHHPDGRMVKIKKKDFGLKRIPIPK